MSLPQPITNTDVFLVAVIAKLEEVRMAVIDVESELQKLNAATQSTSKTVVQLDADKIANAINAALGAKIETPSKSKTK